MNKLALIPARAGSKRLPGKNMADLGGRPLIAHTIEAVLGSNLFDEIIVSSDDTAVLDFAETYQGIITHNRHKKLATDEATTIQVLLHLLEKKYSEHLPDVCGLFLPTTPFRTADDIRAGISLLTQRVDSVVSVTPYEAPIEFAFSVNDNGKCMINADSALLAGATRHQLFKPFFRPNGALYIAWTKHLIRHRSFFAGQVAALHMPRERSIDIDEAIDLQIANCLMKASQ